MTNEIIPMTALPKLTDSIKQAVGLSIWNLFRIEQDIVDSAIYLLETPDKTFFLNEDGDVIKECEATDSFEKKNRILFEGYVIPSSVKLNSICNSICV